MQRKTYMYVMNNNQAIRTPIYFVGDITGPANNDNNNNNNNKMIKSNTNNEGGTDNSIIIVDGTAKVNMNEACMALEMVDKTWINYFFEFFGVGFKFWHSLDALLQPESVADSIQLFFIRFQIFIYAYYLCIILILII